MTSREEIESTFMDCKSPFSPRDGTRTSTYKLFRSSALRPHGKEWVRERSYVEEQDREPCLITLTLCNIPSLSVVACVHSVNMCPRREAFVSHSVTTFESPTKAQNYSQSQQRAFRPVAYQTINMNNKTQARTFRAASERFEVQRLMRDELKRTRTADLFRQRVQRRDPQ